MLTSSSKTVAEISEAVGYENVEHFPRTFKKQVGISPDRYRKLQGGA